LGKKNAKGEFQIGTNCNLQIFTAAACFCALLNSTNGDKEVSKLNCLIMR